MWQPQPLGANKHRTTRIPVGTARPPSGAPLPPVFLLWPRLAVPLDVAWRACVLVGGALAFCALMAFLWLPGAEDRRGGKRPAEHLGPGVAC